MQIVSTGESHESSKPVLWEKYFKILTADFFTQHAKLFMLIISWQFTWEFKAYFLGKSEMLPAENFTQHAKC